MIRQLLKQREIDHVWVLPVARHPFDKKMTPFANRFGMCRLAFSKLSKKVVVKRVEQKLAGKNYTIRTLRYLTKKYSGTRFVLVIGADSYRTRHRWKNFKKIQALVDIAIFARGPRSEIPNVSSTKIREAIAADRSLDKLVPKPISRYINKEDLTW